MNSIEQVRQMATEIAENAQNRVSELERQLADIEARKAKIEAERNMARGAAQRLAIFPVKSGIDYLCPRCWIEEGKMSPMRPIPSKTRDDFFRCNLCPFELTIAH